LDCYHIVNESKPEDNKLQIKEFYNDAVNKEIELKPHYFEWIKAKKRSAEKGEAFDRRRIFSLCCYPWVLDPAAKVNWFFLFCSKEFWNLNAIPR
jgi:hypothetical protein